MTILVTGANGYLGNLIVKGLVAKGKTVRAMVRDEEKTRIRLGALADKIEVIKGDVTDRASLTPLMQGVTTVIHLVAIAIEKGGATYADVNYQGTVNVVDAANEAGVERFINMSQNGADSSLPYRFLKSKGRAQEYVRDHAKNWTALRPSAIFGPQDEFFNSIARLMKITPLVFPLIGGGKAEFQPVSGFDVAEATVRCVDDDTTIGKELVLGGPEVLNLGEIEHRIHGVVGGPKVFVPTPVGVLRPAVWVMERVLPGTPVTSSLLELLSVPNIVKDNALVNHFKMTPKSFSGENIKYLNDSTFGQIFSKLFKNTTIN